MGCGASSQAPPAADATNTKPSESSAPATKPAEPSKPVAKPAEPSAPATKPAILSATKWHEIELPDTVVVRKEIRHMPKDEQLRVAAAYAKMRENEAGVPGSSPYFRLAVVHGGLPPLSHEQAPEYCAHRRECFPTWHRPYLLDFERMLRRADIALGGDGNIGLPYWDWSIAEHTGAWRLRRSHWGLRPDEVPMYVLDECPI